jgi:hypothetical protein
MADMWSGYGSITGGRCEDDFTHKTSKSIRASHCDSSVLTCNALIRIIPEHGFSSRNKYKLKIGIPAVVLSTKSVLAYAGELKI